MSQATIRCGSAHCKGGHRWLEEGTVYARLSPVNCGAINRVLTPEELVESDANLRRNIHLLTYPMTIERIEERIAAINASAGDPEVAHGLEDALYAEFIQHIANGGTKDLREKAKLVLTTVELDFARWCA
jgi:hypothetical protein